MSALDSFSAWARRAAQEQPPLPDVTGPVLARLSRAEEPEAAMLRWLWSAAAAGLCAAAVCAAVGYFAWSDFAAQGPWLAWARDLQMGWIL